MRHFLVAVYAFVMAVSGVQAGHHEGGDDKQAVVIGTVFSDEGAPYSLIAGDTGLQQIWLDYIKSQNDRRYKKNVYRCRQQKQCLSYSSWYSI